MEELLRFATAGSIDDGKSTLIGRLLHDTGQTYEDQAEAVERASRARGDADVDLALFTDGLRDEREQGITIDVAYRSFATAKRRFILADTPGHVQHTRNMVTGISTADAVVVLVDATHGVVDQTRRHLALASLLRVPHLVICVNKMDLVGWDARVFDAIRDDAEDVSARVDIADLSYIPVSALHGDNVVARSAHSPWYEGPPLIAHLEQLHLASDRNLVDVRFPVQRAVRTRLPGGEGFRGYAGQVAGGVLRVGDEVVVLPSGYGATVASIETFDGPLEEAFPPMAVTITLSEDLDVGRGDMICRTANRPVTGQDIQAMVFWMAQEPLRPGARFLCQHTTKTTRVMAGDLLYRLDVANLHRRQPEAGDSGAVLGENEIGRLSLRSAEPLTYDPYRRNRATGSFILIDPGTFDTVGAGTILDPER